MDAAEYLAKAAELTTPHLREVARVLGAMRNINIGARKEKVDTVPTEVFDVELGANIGRLLPNEYLGLIVDELEDDFYRRFAGGQLLQYRLRSVEHVAKGAIILLEDSSGSMEGPKHRWAKAMGLALGGIARDDDRAFHAIEFGGPHTHRHHPFPNRAAWTPDAMIEYAGSFLDDGGTNFDTVIDAAIGLLDAEHQATGRVTADIVLVTDGISQVTDAWLDGFHAAQERLGFKLYALVVGNDARLDTLTRFANYVGTVRSFHDGTDARCIFTEVA
jgi:uncharacterized protein with von Willebrand factor type A (vWA) domain